jgi:hypothetical protein
MVPDSDLFMHETVAHNETAVKLRMDRCMHFKIKIC